MLEKNFPADVRMDRITFLNDKKVDASLYAFYLEISVGQEVEGYTGGQTVVYKKKIPTQKELCEKIGIRSPKTLRVHHNYLLDAGYLIDKGSFYIVSKQMPYFGIPASTLDFLRDTVKEDVYKVYIYLGQRWRVFKTYGTRYEFSLRELGRHTGVSTDGNPKHASKLLHILQLLQKIDLIRYEECVVDIDGRPVEKLRLLNYSFDFRPSDVGASG